MVARARRFRTAGVASWNRTTGFGGRDDRRRHHRSRPRGGRHDRARQRTL